MDISGTFSPQYLSLTGETETTVQAQFRVSTTTQPGNYTLAVGIETRSFRVLSMISVEVLRSNNSSAASLLNVAVFGGAPILIVVVLVLLRRRRSLRKHG